MRVAVFHNQPSGGARRALHGFCAELARRHQLHIYSLSTADREMLLDEDLGCPVERIPYVPHQSIRYALYVNDVRRLRSLGELERVNRETAELIDQGGYDLALVDECRYTNVPDILRFLKTPAAYYCHHRLRPLESTSWPAAKPLYVRARRLWHLPFEAALERRLWSHEVTNIRAANLVFANSEYTRTQLEGVVGVRSVVCPPGVELPPPSRRDERGYVLSVGGLQPQKGHEFVIRSLGRIPAPARPPLMIAANESNPDTAASVRLAASRSGVRLTVRFKPRAEELDALYRQASAFVYGAVGEPLGLAPLEAMARAVPVVAIGEAGVLETVRHGDTGYLVPRDEDEFAHAVQLLLTSPRRRRRLGLEGRRMVAEEWSWQRRAGELDLRLHELATRPRVSLRT